MKASNNSSDKADAVKRDRISFALSGRSPGLDHRTNAYRDDVADIALAGTVLAHYYAIPVVRRCLLSSANIHEDHSEDTTMTSQLLHGESFAVVDQNAGWAWGYCEHDHYVGYIHEEALGEMDARSHIVVGLEELPLGSLVTEAGDGRLPIRESVSDPVAMAESLIDTPYLWGGRTCAGIDCSGLTQLAYGLAGHSLPRDTDLQLAALETDIANDAPLQRGDIVFFPDHVGLMTDAETLLHATQHWGRVVLEPLTDVVERIGVDHKEPVIGRKRLS